LIKKGDNNMKGDFTRSTFKPEKQYSGVRMQQGRVQLDADWNEHIDISSHRINTGARDSIGPCGAPQDGGGFKIDPTSDYKNLTISHGRIYVDGIMCENYRDIDITEQDDLPGVSQLPGDKGVYLAYLDVWKRHMTAIEDPQIREVALGRPDTATRTKTVWQAKLWHVTSQESATIDCPQVAGEWNKIIAGSDAELAAFTKQDIPSKNPCIVSPGAGYRGLENQLYRVEIHKGGNFGEATFKWSRDNGSVVFAIEEFVKDANNNPTKLKVKQLGKDKTLSLQAGDWVEVLDDATELSDNPIGTLAQITENPDVAGRIITLNQIVSGNLKLHPKVRRWDQGSDAISVTPPSGSDSIELEDGIFVRFSGTSFRAGDYWLIPARTATGDIEWPTDESKNPPEPIPEPPEGIRHHYCRLAVLKQDGTNNWSLVGDCRKLFPAVTELTGFFHVCGDGQEAMPGEELPGYLQVGAANGKQPVTNAKVRFQVTIGQGTIMDKDGLQKGIGKDAFIEVSTGIDGIATCRWLLDTATQGQQVEATLRDACDKPVNIPIRFNANLSVAGEVAYTPPGCTSKNTDNGIPTVEELLEANIPGWPPKDAAGNTTVKDVLDTFLCNFNAADLPIQKNSALCKILNDDASVKTVQDALNALCSMRGGCCVFVDDEEHLKKALSELRNGGIICLLAGEFKMEAITLEGLSNIVIRGCNLASRLISDIRIGKCKNVVIENLDISGSMEAEEVDGLSLSENIISQTEKQIFKLVGCSNVKVEKNMLHTYNGIIFDGNDIEISDNIITLLQSNETSGWGILIESSTELKIQRNRLETEISETQINQNNHGHIEVLSGQNVDIENNLIQTKVSGKNEKTIIYGIELSTVTGHISVIRNRVEGVNGEAVIIYASNAARIYGNELSSSNSNVVMAKENGLIELLDNTITSDSYGINVNSGKDLKMQGNRVETNASLVAETQGIDIVTVSGLLDVDITDNRITTLNPDSILKKHIIGLVIRGVNGLMSVNNNVVNGVNQEAVQIISNEATAKFHGNSLDSLWHIESITGGIIISSITMECKDIIFGGNQCALKIPNNDNEFIKLLAAGKINVRQVYFPGVGNITATGNRCSENLKHVNIYSILASNEIAILLGNITTNKISPEPDPNMLNLRGR
jgi:hypothetical protein